MSIGSSRAGSDMNINQKIVYAPSSGVISNNPQVINNIKVIMSKAKSAPAKQSDLRWAQSYVLMNVINFSDAMLSSLLLLTLFSSNESERPISPKDTKEQKNIIKNLTDNLKR